MLQRRVVRQQRRLVHTLTVGLRREDPTRIWERRCPLTPTAVNELVRDGARVLVQPCDRRVFPIREFVEVRGDAVGRPEVSCASTRSLPPGFLRGARKL